MIEIRRARRTGRALDLTPLIDVVFQLLVFFLLTATLSREVVPLALPPMQQTQAEAPEGVVISITRDGEVFVDDRPVPLDRLEPILEAVARAEPQRKIALRGDVGARYGLFMRVLDALRGAGLADVVLVTGAPEEGDEGS